MGSVTARLVCVPARLFRTFLEGRSWGGALPFRLCPGPPSDPRGPCFLLDADATSAGGGPCSDPWAHMAVLGEPLLEACLLGYATENPA